MVLGSSLVVWTIAPRFGGQIRGTDHRAVRGAQEAVGCPVAGNRVCPSHRGRSKGIREVEQPRLPSRECVGEQRMSAGRHRRLRMVRHPAHDSDRCRGNHVAVRRARRVRTNHGEEVRGYTRR